MTIVHLCGLDLLKLTNEEPVDIGVVRILMTDGNASYIQNDAQEAARTAEDVRARRSDARRKLVGKTKTGQKWMKALFPGRCYFPNCRNVILKGDRIVYDYDGGRALCEAHGLAEYPNLPKPQEVTA